MIALLAAVPQETRLIRDAMENVVEEAVLGLTFYKGQISAQNVCLSHSGIGKAAASAAAITHLLHTNADALWLFGCGGAYPGSGLNIGDLALASHEIFGDEGVTTSQGFEDLKDMGFAMRKDDMLRYNSWPTDINLHDWAAENLELTSGPFVTVSTCTGTTSKAVEIKARTSGICENMEGAAVALACQQLSVPLLEIRGISNLVEDRDTSHWDLQAGMDAAQHAILALFESRAAR